MKKILSFMLVALVALTGCGNTSSSSSLSSEEVSLPIQVVDYTAIFVADGDIVSVQHFTNVDKTTIVEPDVPEKFERPGHWEPYILIDNDIIINALYDFTASFYADDKFVADVIFTNRNHNIVEPEIPNPYDGTAIWEDYTVGDFDFRVDAIFCFTATFMLAETVIAVIPFTHLDHSPVVTPEVPVVAGFVDISWPSYVVTNANLVVNANFTAIEYVATFIIDETYITGVYEEIQVTFDMGFTHIVEPELVYTNTYYKEWESYERKPENFTVNEIKVKYDQTLMQNREDLELAYSRADYFFVNSIYPGENKHFDAFIYPEVVNPWYCYIRITTYSSFYINYSFPSSHSSLEESTILSDRTREAYIASLIEHGYVEIPMDADDISQWDIPMGYTGVRFFENASGVRVMVDHADGINYLIVRFYKKIYL
jgi:hypothetical protein